MTEKKENSETMDEMEKELEQEMADFKKGLREFRKEVLKKGKRPAIRYRYNPKQHKKLKDFTPAAKAEYLLQSSGQLKLLRNFQEENPFTKHFLENILSKTMRLFPIKTVISILLGIIWKQIKGEVRYRYYDTAERLRVGRGYWHTLYFQEKLLKEEEGKRWDGMTMAERLEDERNSLLDMIKSWRIDLCNETDPKRQDDIRRTIASADEEVNVIRMKEKKESSTSSSSSKEL